MPARAHFGSPFHVTFFLFGWQTLADPTCITTNLQSVAPGRAFGEEHAIPLLESLQEAIVRGYGAEMYAKMVQLAKDELGGNALP